MAIIYDTLFGGENDDDLTAHSVADGDGSVVYATIHGGEGNDTIKATQDFVPWQYALYGDGGNDIISDSAYSTAALLSGGDGDDTIYSRGEQQTVDGGDGYDKLVSSSGTTLILDPARIKNIEELVIGGWTNVADFDLPSFGKISVLVNVNDPGLFFSHAINLDNLTIDTNGTFLRLDGSMENDRFDMSHYTSNFYVFGGGGNDTIIAGTSAINADGGDGDDYVRGSDSNDTLSGSKYAQSENAYDTVLGLGGDDKITFNTGGGLLDGGDGEDRLVIFPLDTVPISLDKVTLNNIEIIQFFSAAKVNLGSVDLSDVKKLIGDGELFMTQDSIFDNITIAKDSRITLHGSQSDDVVSFSGSQGTLYMHGGDGDDTLSTDGSRASIWGEGGDDTLSSSRGASRLDGGDGNDVIRGGDRNDKLASGEGLDQVYGGGGHDIITLSILTANDVKTVNAGADDDEIFATHSVAVTGHGRIDGGSGNDILNASGDLSGYDIKNVETLQLMGKTIASAKTFDSFEAIFAKHSLLASDEKIILELSRAGTFTWHGGTTVLYASLTGSAGKDNLDFSASENGWLIAGGNGEDKLVGGAFADHLKGDNGADVLNSGAGNDEDFGGSGNDTINSGDGDDFIDGGDGNDLIYDGGSGYNDIKGDNGNDTILGYGKEDNIDGGAGNDVLVAGRGLVHMYGNTGRDRFVFSDGMGVASVDDFDASGKNHDVIDFSGESQIKDFKHLMADHVKALSNGAGVLITFGSSEVALLGIEKSDLDASDFIF